MRVGLVGVGRIGAFHAQTLLDVLDPHAGDELVLADALPEAAQRVAATLGATAAPSVDALLDSTLDALVIASSTPSHAGLLRAGMARGIPTFCEKPVALDLAGTIALAQEAAAATAPVQVGFHRRFDAAYRRVRDAVAAGELGPVHAIRAASHDRTPPPAGFVATSGGIFRDCSIHDFDAVRFVTGVEFASVHAVGGGKGAGYFAEGGDVATGVGTFRLTDGTVGTFSTTRYHGAGQDVRLEVHGEAGSLGVGHGPALAIRSAEPGVTWPPGPAFASFMDRFLPAYRAELAAFVQVARGEIASPCTVADALAAFRVAEAAQRSLDSGLPVALDSL